MYKAVVGFSGKLTMGKGEVKDLKGVEKYIIKDLLEAGYIQEVKPTNKKK